MADLTVKLRDKMKRKTKELREQGIIPAVLYGEGLKTMPVQVNLKDFKEAYKKAGESSIILLKVVGRDKKEKELEVLIHDISVDPLSGDFIHADFYHPSMSRKVEAEVPLVFEGSSPAVEKLKGTLVKEIQAIKVKGFARSLPKEIKVDIGTLTSFDDKILIQDIKLPDDVTIDRDAQEVVAVVVPPRTEEEIAAATETTGAEEAIKEEEEEIGEEIEEPEGGSKDQDKDKKGKEEGKKKSGN